MGKKSAKSDPVCQAAALLLSQVSSASLRAALPTAVAPQREMPKAESLEDLVHFHSSFAAILAPLIVRTETQYAVPNHGDPQLDAPAWAELLP